MPESLSDHLTRARAARDPDKPRGKTGPKGPRLSSDERKIKREVFLRTETDSKLVERFGNGRGAVGRGIASIVENALQQKAGA